MKQYFKILSALLLCTTAFTMHALASSHREAPLISNDPLADNTDLYAFRSPADSSKIILIANYIPFEHPAGGPNWYTFGENIRYEIHIDNNTATPGDDIIYRFTFTSVNNIITCGGSVIVYMNFVTYIFSKSVPVGATGRMLKRNIVGN